MDMRKSGSYFRAFLGIMHGSRSFGGPVQAHLVLTERCNLRCIQCHFHSGSVDVPLYADIRDAQIPGNAGTGKDRRERQRDADPELFHRCIDELLAMGTSRFEINACGEPFLHANIMEFIERLKKAGAYCTGFTNGTLLNESSIEELVKLGFDDLKISVQAGTSELYGKIHPGISGKVFANVERNILRFAERKAAYGRRRPKLTLVFVVMAQNYSEMHEFAEFAVRTGVEEVMFSPLDDAGGDPALEKLALSDDESLSLLASLPDTQRFLEAGHVRHNIPQFRRIFFNGRLDTSLLYEHIPCYFGWLTPYIFPDGGVYPCSRSFSPLGNVYEQSFEQVWRGESYRHFRRQAKGIDKRRSPVEHCDCGHCVNNLANFRVYRMIHPIRSLPLFSKSYKDKRKSGRYSPARDKMKVS